MFTPMECKPPPPRVEPSILPLSSMTVFPPPPCSHVCSPACGFAPSSRPLSPATTAFGLPHRPLLDTSLSPHRHRLHDRLAESRQRLRRLHRHLSLHPERLTGLVRQDKVRPRRHRPDPRRLRSPPRQQQTSHRRYRRQQHRESENSLRATLCFSAFLIFTFFCFSSSSSPSLMASVSKRTSAVMFVVREFAPLAQKLTDSSIGTADVISRPPAGLPRPKRSRLSVRGTYSRTMSSSSSSSSSSGSSSGSPSGPSS